MKKLMVLSLVLAMGTLASASFSLVVNNADVPNGASISISNAVPLNLFESKLWAIVVDSQVASLGTPNPVSTANLSNSVVGLVEDSAVILEPAGTTGWYGVTMWGAFTGPLAAGTVLYSGISIEGFSDTGFVTVYLYEVTEGAAFGDPAASADVAVMIPEPMTMGLLGLGALFLRRRK